MEFRCIIYVFFFFRESLVLSAFDVARIHQYIIRLRNRVCRTAFFRNDFASVFVRRSNERQTYFFNDFLSLFSSFLPALPSHTALGLCTTYLIEKKRPKTFGPRVFARRLAASSKSFVPVLHVKYHDRVRMCAGQMETATGEYCNTDANVCSGLFSLLILASTHNIGTRVPCTNDPVKNIR